MRLRFWTFPWGAVRLEKNEPYEALNAGVWSACQPRQIPVLTESIYRIIIAHILCRRRRLTEWRLTPNFEWRYFATFKNRQKSDYEGFARAVFIFRRSQSVLGLKKGGHVWLWKVRPLLQHRFQRISFMCACGDILTAILLQRIVGKTGGWCVMLILIAFSLVSHWVGLVTALNIYYRRNLQF